MCGIVGAVSTKPSMSSRDREKFFRTALVVDQIRGFHSTGFFKVNASYSTQASEHGSIYSLKKAFNANDFLELKAVDNMLTGLSNTEILVGHNRWATMGDVTHATAHPFTHGDITLVHNGTLHWWNDLPDANQFDVDSEAIAYALSTVEPDKAKVILEKLDGAYALVWYDARIGKLRAARNEERPLHFCYSKDANDLLFASEAGMLEWLAGRHGFEPQEVWQLKEGCLLTLDREDLTAYETEEFEVYDDGYGDYTKWGNNYYSSYKDTKKLEDKSGKKDDGVEDLLLNSYGLRKGGRICFDPTEFVFYPNNSARDPHNRWGKLVGMVDCPDGARIRCEVDGLKSDEYAEMVGYSVSAEVLNAVRTEIHHIPQTILKCKKPDYLLDDGDDDDDVYSVQGDIINFKAANATVTRYGPFNTLVTEDRWLDLIEDGCEMCGGEIDEDDDEVTGWDSTGKPICKHCIQANGWEGTLPAA